MSTPSIARLLAGAALLAILPVAAQAQTTPTGPETTGANPATPDATTTEGDILVTARRQSERLQDVPIAVTAFSGEALASRSVDTLDQIAKYTPNIRFDGAAALSGGNYNATVFIRGVGQNDFAIFSDPGVGFYVDDVYYARSIGSVLDAVDLDSVQVLRGPQGTLFGKNTVGGAVLITTGQPDTTRFSGKIEGTYGSFNRIDVKGYVNIPIVSDRVALRISGATVHRDGYVKRLLDGGTEGNRNADSLRAKLRIKATDDLTIDISGDYTRARENSAPSKLIAVANAPGITGTPFLTNYNAYIAPGLGITAPNGQKTLNASFITSDPFTTYATGRNRNDLDLWGVQGVIRYGIGNAELKSITAYRDMKAGFNRDGDNTPFTFRETVNDDKQWQFSQELQLTGKAVDDRLSYVLGGYYFKEKASDIARADLALGLQPPAALTPPYTPAVFIQNYTDNYSYAFFGQASFEIVPRLNIEVGGRWNKDHKIFISINTRQRDNVQFINVTRAASWSAFTPHVGVNFKPNRDILLYASFSKGFKQGGFNGRPLASADEVTAYEPETLDSYEIGIKADLLDHTLTANLAGFHSIYKNIQLTVNQTPLNFVANAAAGKIDGFELELIARPARWFKANASLGYLDARYTSVGQGLGPTQILPITLASKFVKTPKFTATAGVEISHDFNGNGNLSLRGDITMYSRIYQDVANTPLITEPGYVLVNARLTYALPGDAIQFSAFVTNLTNALYLASGNASSSFGLAEVSYGRPREWGISASYRF
ncbi:TonB-dependent receptor [Sphingomonas sp. RT2P30]|uniref:TonB-dependent receptor n=1 Tax=Parasphingomonas halimpatiens TaxID=3096162 RepID=UPI002FC647CB